MNRWLKSALIIVGIGFLCGATIEHDLDAVLTSQFQTELPSEKRECPPEYREIDCPDDHVGDGPCCKEIFDGCNEKAPDIKLPETSLPKDVDFKNFGTWFLVIMVVSILLLFLVYLKGKVLVPTLDSSSVNVRGIVEALEERVGKMPHEQYALRAEWDAAIHAMVLRAIVDLFLVQPELDKPATTGREIAYYAKPPYGSDIEPLIDTVERILFARYHATEEDYRRLVPHYESLTTHVAKELARAEV